jgi:hypothetical protein
VSLETLSRAASQPNAKFIGSTFGRAFARGVFYEWLVQEMVQDDAFISCRSSPHYAASSLVQS